MMNKLKIIEYILVSLLTTFIYLYNIDKVRFHPDESQWISTSLYFDAFIEGNIDSKIWEPSYWTLTQPPITRYIIGISRNLNNSGLDKMNKPWDFRVDKDTNELRGAMPDTCLLRIARLPMVIMAILSIILIFYITREYMGILISYTTFLLLLLNPLINASLTRAMSEAPLLFFIILMILFLYYTGQQLIFINKLKLNNIKQLIRITTISMLAGLVAGFAGATKLSGFSIIFITFLFPIIIFFLSTYLKKISIINRILLFLVLSVVFLSSFIITFISVNPFLYKNSFNRTVAMFKWRVKEMNIQREEHPSQNLTNLRFTNRISLISKNILQKYASISFNGSWLLNLFLFVTGFLIGVYRSFRFIKGKKSNLYYLILMFFCILFAGPSLLTPLDWDRYFYLPVLFSTILISIGIAETLRFIYMNNRLQKLTSLLPLLS